MKRNTLIGLMVMAILVASCSNLFAQPAQETVEETKIEKAVSPAPAEQFPAGEFWAAPPEGMTPPDGMMPQSGMMPPEGMDGFNRFDRGDNGMMRGGMGGGMMGGALGQEGSFSSDMDTSVFETSVSSPENPLTYYDPKDILKESEYTEVLVVLKNGTLETCALPDDLSISVNDEGNVVITNNGKNKYNYVLSGSWTGTVMVTSKKANYMVTLDGVTITGTTLPGMQLKSETKAFLLLKGENYVSDSTDNTKKGALTSGGDVIINGTGTLHITAYRKHGLKVDGTVRLVSGTLHCVTDENAEGNAVSVDDAYIQDGGVLKIEANGSVYTSESKGLKVNGREAEENAKGYLVINGGTVDITSVGKAMSAGWKLAEDAETETTADDPTPNLIINGGVLRLKTTGTPYEYSDEESLSPEGLEAKNLLQINGGYIEIEATDDGLNAGGSIELNGGYVYAYSRGADALDSNGTVVINGGTAVLLGAGGAEMGLDMDFNNAFSYHGGLVIAMGGGNNTPGASDTDACVISFQSPVSSGSSFALVDEQGRSTAAFQIPSWYTSGTAVEVLSSEIQIGSSYRLLSGVSASSTAFFNGLYLGEVSLRGGTETASYSVTSFVTGGEGGMFGGMRGGMDGDRGMRMDPGFQNGQPPMDGWMDQNMRGGQKNRNPWIQMNP